mmetsp:Transcript_83819/g.233814  ORF Transcript_83819/g.233814 Transcript_83819/m.233814 type:complete len:256 (-) Transcript_83819:691-1458(-)
MPLTTRPNTASKDQRSYTLCLHWLSERPQPVVHPKIAGHGCRPVGCIVAETAVTPTRALAVAFVQPVGRHPLVEVTRSHELLPDQITAARCSWIYCQTTQIRIQEASPCFHCAEFSGIDFCLRPNRKHHGSIDHVTDSARQRFERRIAFRVGLKIAILHHIVIVNDEHAYGQVQGPVSRGYVKRDRARHVAESGLPEQQSIFPDQRGMPCCVCITFVDGFHACLIATGRICGNPEVEQCSSVRLPSHAADTVLPD